MRNGVLVDDNGRALSMSAELFEQFCRQAGVSCIGQEIINWRGRYLIDCLSLLTPKGSAWERPNQAVENRDFMTEARMLSRLAPLYTRGARKDGQ
jgi:hypothetical protein